MASLNVVALGREAVLSATSGCLKVTSNGLLWFVGFNQGKVQYAVHSIQPLETLDYHLLKLGYDRAAQSVATLAPATVTQMVGPIALTDPRYLLKLIAWLVSQSQLNQLQAAQLVRSLSQDALESLLWLSAGESEWCARSAELPMVWEEGVDLLACFEQLGARRETWQTLWPRITSPYQRPYCPDLAQIHQPVPNGLLSQALLGMLVKFMQGTSIRRLSLLLKQDELQVATLLYPYVEHGVLLLQPPDAPYKALPPIPPRFERRKRPRNGQPSGSGAVASAPTSTRVYKVVCIDDSPAMLETIQQYLGTDRFELITVDNPMESLTALFGMKPDLILMDVSMPGINGNRLCQILRRSSTFKELPIIMVSGNAGALDRAKAESSGATDYLTKPFSKEGLLAIVDKYLSRNALTL